MKRKIISFFFAIIFFLLISPNFNQKVFAVGAWDCSLSYEPFDLTPETKPVNITIDTKGQASGEYAVAVWQAGAVGRWSAFPNSITTAVGGKITFEITTGVRSYLDEGGTKVRLNLAKVPGAIKDNLRCKSDLLMPVTKSEESGADYCTINFDPQRPKPGDEIKINTDFKNTDVGKQFRGNDNTSHSVVIEQDENPTKILAFTSSQLESGSSIGNFDGGNYSLKIFNTTCSPNDLFACFTNPSSCNTAFYVDPNGGSSGNLDCSQDSSICGNGDLVCVQKTGDPEKFVCDKLPTEFPSSFTGAVAARQMSPCGKVETNDKIGQYCASVVSFLGANNQVPTSAPGLISKLLQIVLAISGVVALIFIIVSGYRFMLSQGNPEAVQEARESLTSAIVGLLFIIFALVILQLITVNILHIPGFNP